MRGMIRFPWLAHIFLSSLDQPPARYDSMTLLKFAMEISRLDTAKWLALENVPPALNYGYF